MPRYKGYVPERQDVDVRPIPLSEIYGTPLDETAIDTTMRGYGPAQDFTGRPQGSYGQPRQPDFAQEQGQYNQGLMNQEMMVLADMGGRMDESDDMMMAQSRQEQIVEEIQRLMAEHQTYAQQMLAKEPPFNEAAFQNWYAQHARRLGLNPNPDDPRHFYDYRAAYKAGAQPGPDNHWPSQFKTEGHPRMFVGGMNTKTGQSYDSLSFGQAFKAARSSGAKTFIWRGRKFTTRLR